MKEGYHVSHVVMENIQPNILIIFLERTWNVTCGIESLLNRKLIEYV